MKSKVKTLLLLVLALVLSLALFACNGENNDQTQNVAEDIVNGDFEDVSSGQWVGWTRKDAAFNFRGVTDVEKVNGVTMEKSGKYYFAGTVGGNPAMRGTLTSDPFKLGGIGYITFKMGGGKDTTKCYVEFIVDEKVVATVTNGDCDGTFITDHLITKVVDLSAYIGKTVTIKVTDNDDRDDCSWLNLDAFKVCKTQSEVDAANADHARQIAEYGEKEFVEDPASTAIVNGGFETGDLTGWKILEGKAFPRNSIVPTSQYYWNDRLVYGEGEYYLDGNNNGAIQETLTGAIRSTKFTLGGDGYVTFMLGSGGGGDNCYIALCDGETDEELIKQSNTYFSDPARALTLLRYYVDASQYKGKVLYVKIVDEREGGFGFITVDDIRVSMTKEEVMALQVEQVEKINAETYTSASYNDLVTLRDYYTNYPYLFALNSLTMRAYAENAVVDCAASVDLTQLVKNAQASYGNETIACAVTKVTFGATEITSGFDAVDMSVPGFYTVTYGATYKDQNVSANLTVAAVKDNNSVVNGGFESGNLVGWTVLTEGWANVGGQNSGVISAASYWGEELPYNQAGNYHLDGWNTGIDEGATWKVRSTVFTLAGSGFITLRMGGHAAAVHVYRADGTELFYGRQSRFNDANFPHVGLGGSWADMATYVIDLHDYVGENLYIELCDEAVDGWAHAFFDEVVTYYETAPDYATNYETVMDGHTAEETAQEIQIAWKLLDNLVVDIPAPVIPEVVPNTILNGGFETGDLTGWTILTAGWTENANQGVISAATYWGEELPYNQSGNYHLDGWYTGIGEGDTWKIRSSVFKLAGSGYISLKMGGHAAAVHVYKADGTEVFYAKANRFSDTDFPYVSKGGSWADMATYVLDLRNYIGENLYIELCDEAVDGWAHAFFDEVVTYYEVAPDYANLFDTVMDGHKAEETPVEVKINWILAENLLAK